MANLKASIVIRTTSPEGKRGWVKATGKKSDPAGPLYIRYCDGSAPKYVKKFIDSESKEVEVGDSYDLALIAKMKFERKSRAQSLGVPQAPTNSVSRKTISIAVQEYLLEVQAQKASATHVSYRHAVQAFAIFSEKKYLDEIMRVDLLAFVTHLRDLRDKDGGRRYGERSINKALTRVAIFLKASGVPKLLKKGDWPRYSEPPVKFYTRGQVKALFAACTDEKQWLLIAFLLMTGMRRGEAQHAEYSDIDFEGKVIRVVDKPHLGWHPKTWECREIPIPDELVTALRDVGDGFIFKNKNGGMTGRNDLYKEVKRIASNAGMRGADCHTFRRTYGTMWVQKAPIQEVQNLMGHKSVETTMRYLGIGDKRSKETRDRVASVFSGVPTTEKSHAA
jgi:integrase